MERVPIGPVEQSVLPMTERIRVSCTWIDDPEKVLIYCHVDYHTRLFILFAPYGQVEMIEEYRLDGKSLQLQHRKWRRNDKLKGPTPWMIEFGTSPIPPAPNGAKNTVSESASNPAWVALDQGLYWLFKVDNISFPIDTYSVQVDDEKQQLVLKTTNKKYFKRWSIGPLLRSSTPLDISSVSMVHEGGCLFIRVSIPFISYPSTADSAHHQH
jgi:hypothetical protein